jgi:hypothetical protein
MAAKRFRVSCQYVDYANQARENVLTDTGWSRWGNEGKSEFTMQETIELLRKEYGGVEAARKIGIEIRGVK